jgi:hypothetical protein
MSVGAEQQMLNPDPDLKPDLPVDLQVKRPGADDETFAHEPPRAQAAVPELQDDAHELVDDQPDHTANPTGRARQRAQDEAAR